MKKLLLVFLIFGVAACSLTQPRRETYDLIGTEMGKAAEGKAKPAQADAVAASLLPPLTIEMPKPQQQRDERFNLTFSNAPAQQFFMSIVSGTRYNMLVHPDVSGTISATLKDVTVFEALDAIRELYGYEYKVEGTRITIMPLTMQTRVFQVNYLNSSRRGSSDIRVISGSVADAPTTGTGTGTSTTTAGTSSSSGAQRSLDSSKISTTSDNNFWKELRESLEAIVGSKGSKDGRSVVISPLSGVVVVRAMPDELRNVATFLKATQLSVDRQVILEAKIVEVQLNDSFQSGINWASFASLRASSSSKSSIGFLAPGSTLSATGSMTSTGNTGITATAGTNLSAPTSTAGSLFGLAFQNSNFAALISLLETQGTVHVLSSPRIATMNNQKAVLKVGTDEFFVTKVTTNTGTTYSSGTTSQPTASVDVQPFFSGVSLDVTPQIDEHDNIILHVHPSVSKVTTVTKEINLGTSIGTMTLPLASSDVSETDSVVRGQNGSIVAIGGLMRHASISDRSQLPGAGDVPLLGNLFRNTNRTTQKRELVILIKPIVVQGDSNWKHDLLDSQQRIEKLAPPAIYGLQ
ncbi:MAG: pilus (MSHA type) biogenesis protein MshL [Burkholderiaceae bacterium]|nr:pilus (MSHA type) biogenesis protein MshL [Burkholderiaceae bacterium]